MKDLTIEMLKNKITAHEKRIVQARRVVEELEQEIQTKMSEISSFLHCVRILEDADPFE